MTEIAGQINESTLCCLFFSSFLRSVWADKILRSFDISSEWLIPAKMYFVGFNGIPLIWSIHFHCLSKYQFEKSVGLIIINCQLFARNISYSANFIRVIYRNNELTDAMPSNTKATFQSACTLSVCLYTQSDNTYTYRLVPPMFSLTHFFRG